MRLDTTQQLRQTQEMRLSPRIIQAMEILQLPAMALEERVEAELQSNPVLEMQESTDSDGAEAALREVDRGEQQMRVDEDRGNRDDFNRLDDMTAEYGQDVSDEYIPARSSHTTDDGRDAKLEAMANTPAPRETITDVLMEQWAFLDAPPGILEAGRRIIEYIEADGYLRTSLEDIHADATNGEADVSMESLREALKRVQGLEPTGVGARDLRECLLIQLRARAEAGEDVSLETTLVESFLREIEMNRLPAIAKRLNRDIEEIKAAIERLSHCNPHPGLLVSPQEVPVIHPDVVVEIDEDDELLVFIPDDRFPSLAINAEYARQARNSDTERETRRFLQRNIRSAEWLMEAIAQRRRTVRRVTEEVFHVQREFLDVGREALRPLPMADVADKVGVHVATVSRAVADKYVQTPRGIYPLRMFFSGGTKTSDGQDMSWDAVKVKLKELVDNEDKSKPLNDDQLAEALKQAGIDIARRTVAKYRGVMDIPTARKRRQY